MRRLTFYIIILFIIPLFSVFAQDSQSLNTYFYTKKILSSKTLMWQYPKKYRVSKQKARQNDYFYKVYVNSKGQIIKEERYYQEQMINHYIYVYKKKRLVQEEFYDNLIHIHKRMFRYNNKGKLIKIEQYNREKSRAGDWVYFNQKGNIIKIERYRDKRLSFLKVFKNKILRETRYYNREFVKVTKYDVDGKVISEKTINELEDYKVSVINDFKKVLSFKVNNISKFVIKKGSHSIQCEKKLDQWMISSKGKAFKADNTSVKNLLYNINNLQAFRIFRGKNVVKPKYGVIKSKSNITLWQKNGEKLTIIIGYSVKLQSAYYVRTSDADNEIYLISKYKIDYLLNRRALNFRIRKFVHISANQLKTISIDNLTFIKQKFGWALKSNPKIDKRQIEVLIKTLLDMRAINFLDKPEDKALLSNLKPKHKITLKTDTKDYVILIYMKNRRAYAKTDYSRTIYQVPGYLINYLEKKKKLYIKNR